ncbi:hypothetical protein L0244_03890 [bacterium]|nr:hypothetical protein [bacterium]
MKREKEQFENLSKVFEKIESEFREGMALQKCRQCGCMKEELEQTLSLPQSPEPLKDRTKNWLTKMEPICYSCLGCSYCYPAVAASMLSEALPHQIQGPDCGLEEKPEQWPPVAGEYFVIDRSAPIAVSTLGSVELAKNIADTKLLGINLVGKTETENIGIDKIIKNTITNPNIRTLVLVGADLRGHLPGATLLALFENGIDSNHRVVGSTARRPFLRNVTSDEVDAFRKQVQIVDCIGLCGLNEIAKSINQIEQGIHHSIGRRYEAKKVAITPVEKMRAEEPVQIEMDKAGYFVIIPDKTVKEIIVEHYSYDDRLLRIINGTSSRSIYSTLIRNGWVSQLSHAAYLGKELAKAELSIAHDFKYVQDGA